MTQQNVSLFSRTQGRSTFTKTIHGFLGLPGEVRNRIYNYYFEEDLRCEIAAKGEHFDNKKEKTIKLCLGTVNKDGPVYKYSKTPTPDTPRTLRISKRLGYRSLLHRTQTSWLSSPYTLVFVCKQIHHESLLFVYHNTTFVAAAPRRIMNFLQVLPKKNLSYITKLHLHYTTYGNPRLLKDCVWQQKHLDSWTDTCKAASKRLVNLQELEVWLQVNTTPLFFDLRQAWLKPMLHFRRLSCVRNVKEEVEEIDDTKSIAASPLNKTDNRIPLRVARIHFDTFWSRSGALERNAVPALAHANSTLHHIFGQAISQAILGASEEEAMADFKKAWEGKYQKWQHHLNYYHATS
jgi:hypothetical protein